MTPMKASFWRKAEISAAGPMSALCHAKEAMGLLARRTMQRTVGKKQMTHADRLRDEKQIRENVARAFGELEKFRTEWEYLCEEIDRGAL